MADFAYEPFAQSAISELDELHLDAVEDRIDADLELGRHDQLVGELAALVKRNPLRERLRAQLMLALYRCDRQAEALESYQQFRRGIARELGLDPGPRLQQLEVAILAREPSLDSPPTSLPRAEAAPGAPSRRSPGRGRRARSLALAGLVLVAVTVAAAVLVSSGGRAARVSVIAADSVGAISPARSAVTAVVPVGSSPSAGRRAPGRCGSPTTRTTRFRG